VLDVLVAGAVGLNLYAAALVVARALVWRTRVYTPMLLNIVLSLAPGAVLLVMLGFLLIGPPRALLLPVAVVLGLVWLLLLPNAGYLVTELNMSHRFEGTPVPMWFDVLLVLTLAVGGLVNTVLSTLVAHVVYGLFRHGDSAAALTSPDSVAVACVLLLLVAFGVYLGRHVRANSWDVLLRPWRLVRSVVTHLADGHLRSAAAFTLLYGAFLGLFYLVIAGSVISGLQLAEAASV
jgi:uncharacterized membrane protein